MQDFIQALLELAVFGIIIEFSDKGTHPQDKHLCSWEYRGGGALSWAEPHKFHDLVHLKASQMQFRQS